MRESLERQIIMEDVELALDEELRVLSAQGPAALRACAGSPRTFPCAELEAGGAFVLVSASERDAKLAELTAAAEREGGCSVDEAGFTLARLRVGRPLLGLDFGERAYPQEAGLKGLAVSFNKGCYLGQEVVCTLEHRGKRSRRLVRLESVDGSASIVATSSRMPGAKRSGRSRAVRPTRNGPYACPRYAKMAQRHRGHELRTPHGRFVVRGHAAKD